MEPESFQAAIGISQFALPLAVMMLEDDRDRQYISELYSQYKTLMYKVAYHYFSGQAQEAEDAVGSAVLNLCRYLNSLRKVPPEKIPSYIVCIVRNACNQQAKERKIWHNMTTLLDDAVAGEEAAQHSPVQEAVLSRFTAAEMLKSFQTLSKREKELIRLKHIDMLDYQEIGEILVISAAAARTAVFRAKQKLEAAAKAIGGKTENEDGE